MEAVSCARTETDPAALTSEGPAPAVMCASTVFLIVLTAKEPQKALAATCGHRAPDDDVDIAGIFGRRHGHAGAVDFTVAPRSAPPPYCGCR